MNQESREALIELLFLSLYLDDHLSIAEDNALESALQALGWDSPRPKEIFILNAFAKARKASGCESLANDFLLERSKIIRLGGESPTAFEWLGKILAADGVSMTEARFLDKLHVLLFPGE